MITKNYHKLIAGGANGTAPIISYEGNAIDVNVCYNTEVTQESYKKGIGFQNTTTLMTNVSRNTNGVVFGTGTTAPTINDYCLSGSVVTGISADINRKVQFDDNGFSVISVFTITNNNTDTVTIGEVAYFYYANVGRAFMLDRTVLESPITIPAGGVGQVTYTIRMNYPV